jgi:hypothetical protein
MIWGTFLKALINESVVLRGIVHFVYNVLTTKLSENAKDQCNKVFSCNHELQTPNYGTNTADFETVDDSVSFVSTSKTIGHYHKLPCNNFMLSGFNG